MAEPADSQQQRQLDRDLAANAAQVVLLLELERRAQAEASGYLRRLLSTTLRRTAGQYVLRFGSLEAPADPERIRILTDELVADLEDLRGYDPRSALRPIVEQSGRRGVVWGARGAPVPVRVGLQPSAVVERILDEIPDNVSAAVDTAQRTAQVAQISSWPDLVRLVGLAGQAATSVDRSAATAVATAMNDAIGQVAQTYGAQVLWVAEPNACVVCLALSGHLADPSVGRWFDQEATFGKPGSAPAVWPPDQPLTRPPRHPHCRCVTQTWWGDVRTARQSAPVFDLPAALRREARRSILLGRALPSESDRVRLDAAARLLSRGSGLPRSVEARSRRAVHTGRFSHRTR